MCTKQERFGQEFILHLVTKACCKKEETVAQSTISDNWSLQDISSLLTEGFDRDETAEIVLANNQHAYKPILNAIIQTEALFDFLTDLILCDEILVDEKFISSWVGVNSQIAEAEKNGIVRPYPFLANPEKLEGPRDKIVEHICSTPSLKKSHQENVEGWEVVRQTPDRMLSQTLWGGAGMCARSFVFEKGYTPHPLRRRLLINSGFLRPSEDPLHQLKNFINDRKVRVTKKIYGDDSLLSTYVNIPAIPIRIIQDSDSAEQIISTALEMRDDFKSLRDWLNRFQKAVSTGDSKSLLKHRRELDSVSEYIDKKIGYGSSNNPVSLEAGIGIFKIAVHGNPIESIKNQFGIRARLNKLILNGTGKAEIQKFVKMFGESGTETAYEIERSFSKNG